MSERACLEPSSDFCPQGRAPLRCYRVQGADLPAFLSVHHQEIRTLVDGPKKSPIVVCGLSPTAFDPQGLSALGALDFIKVMPVPPDHAMTWHHDHYGMSAIVSPPSNVGRGSTLFVGMNTYLRYQAPLVSRPWNQPFPDGLVQEAHWPALTADGTVAMVIYQDPSLRHTGTPSKEGAKALLNLAFK